MKINKKYIVIILLFVFLLINLISMKDKSLHPDLAGKAEQAYRLVKYGEQTQWGPFFMYFYGLPLLLKDRDDFVGVPSSGNDRNLYIHGKLDIYPDLDTIYILNLISVISSLILAFFVYKWANELYGYHASLLALFVYIMEPNITAHSQLLQLDINVALMMFVSLYFFWRFYKDQSIKNMVIVGILVGLANLTKQTAIFLYPTILFIFFVLAVTDKKIDWPFLYKTVAILIISIFIINL